MIPAVCVTVRSFTLGDAIEILRRVNQSHLERTLYVENQVGNCRELQFKSLGEDARNLCAHLTTFWRVWYECGPPGNRNWVEATLCQFVADCLLLEVVESGEKTVCDIVADVLKVGAP
jgi:hypothetical protein